MRDLDIHDIRIRAKMYRSGLITEHELINAVKALLQQTHVSGRSEQLVCDTCGYSYSTLILYPDGRKCCKDCAN